MRTKRIYLIVSILLLGGFAFSQAPTATISASSNSVCTGASISFTANTTGSITAYSWSVSPASGYTILPNSFSNVVTIQFSNAITYSVTLFVANGSGTFATGGFISSFKSATASYNATIENTGFPTTLVLRNYSTNYTAINWNFGAVGPIQTTYHASQIYTTSGNYTVSLIAFGSNGCNDTLDYSFVIDGESSVVLPNIFSPNNDGVNDVFKPITKGIHELEVWVYNRYGTIIHTWKGTGGFWDGYTTSGMECVESVYFYVVQAKGFDGKTYSLNSTLTLTR